MGVAIGTRMLMDNMLPEGVDAGVLMGYALENGITTEEVLALAATRAGETNEMLEREIAGFVVFTERTHSRYRQGEDGRGPTKLKAEFSRADMKRAQKAGHMLPRNDFHDAIDYTKDYLDRGNREDVRDDIELVMEDWRDRVKTDLWTRALSKVEDPIGNSGYSPGWAIGSGSSTNFIPTKYGDYEFDDTHTHYIRVNGAMDATNTASTLDQMALELAHHGHVGPKVVYVSEQDLDVYEAINPKRFSIPNPQGITIPQWTTTLNANQTCLGVNSIATGANNAEGSFAHLAIGNDLPSDRVLQRLKLV